MFFCHTNVIYTSFIIKPLPFTRFRIRYGQKQKTSMFNIKKDIGIYNNCPGKQKARWKYILPYEQTVKVTNYVPKGWLSHIPDIQKLQIYTNTKMVKKKNTTTADDTGSKSVKSSRRSQRSNLQASHALSLHRRSLKIQVWFQYNFNHIISCTEQSKNYWSTVCRSS